MRRATASKLALAGALVALAAAALPSAAAAAGSEPNIGIHFEHGKYRLSLGNIGETVVLSVETGAIESQRRVTSTTYLVRGTATANRLEADFGTLGEIAMRFHPSRNRTWEKPHRNCRGAGRFLVRKGTWQGRLRFRGEGGYLSLDMHRVRGTVETIAPKCRGKSGKHRSRRGKGRGRSGKHSRRISNPAISDGQLVEPTQEPELGPEVPVLQSRWRQGVAAAEFIGGAGKEGSVFYASAEEARGRVAVFHSARVETKGKRVRANNALTRADLNPPWPFHRTAGYRAAPDGSRTWSGFLFVSFPGTQHYPLTGEPFEASLEFFPELLVGLIGLLSK